MRLTLRTMLAYLDDILDPQDSEDIAKKIEESEFATELVHRTRDSMRRLRLGVPAVLGKGLGADPNTVAEYLDNTLPTDRVAEFEKICLESDVHLAEVASSHQILTLVLGEPAAIDPASRQRMYRVVTEAAAPPIQNDATQSLAAATASAAAPASASAAAPAIGATPPVPPRRQKPEVPDYLREPRSRLWPVIAATSLGAVVTIVLLVMFGPANWRARVAGIAQSEPAAESPTDETTPADTPAVTPVAPAGTPAAGQDENAPVVEPPIEQAPSDAGTPAAMPDDAPTDAVPSDAVPEVGPPEEPEDTTMPVAADPNAPPAPEAMPDDSDSPAGLRPATGVGLPDTTPDAPLPPEPMPPTENPAEPAAVDAAPSDGAFGRFTTKRSEVLLKFDTENGDWRRLPPMAPLAKGDRLLSLPLFRPSISLSTGISIQPDGATELELVGWTPEGVPIIAVEHGRLLMMTVGKANNSLQMQLGGKLAEITFSDAESTVALEVERILSAGKDPTKEHAPLNAEIYATSGAARVRLDNDPPIDMQAPAQRVLLGEGFTPPGEVPAWVTAEALSQLDFKAVQTVESMLPPEQFVGLILKELSTHRRLEVRSLAIRSATYLNNFEPCVNALNEKDEKNKWSIYIEDLRASIARNPETATLVRNTFDKQRGADGESLFRMLWGYSADDLQNGAAAQLVEGLSNDGLDYRVLSIWNLRDITGEPNHAYYPENLTRQRTASVNTWKDLLRRGKIVPKAVAAATRTP